MLAKTLTLGAAACAALALPLAAAAQPYAATQPYTYTQPGWPDQPAQQTQPQDQPAQQPYPEQPSTALPPPNGRATDAPQPPADSYTREEPTQGGWYTREEGYDPNQHFSGYPEFRSFEAGIQAKIDRGVRENVIDPDDARDLMAQLRDIRRREVREFNEHGWNLPVDARHDIRTDLADLDRSVAEARQKG